MRVTEDKLKLSQIQKICKEQSYLRNAIYAISMNIKKSENPQGYEEFSKVFEEKMFESFGGIAEKAIDEFMSETSKSPEILEEIQKYLTKTVIGN